MTVVMDEKIIETDILCVGGGIAGLMAAIHAAECGAKVVVADKANTKRSGAGATGNDHFRAYIPDYHGPDMEPVVQEVADSQVGFTRPYNFVRTWMAKSFDIVKLWDSWGIPMKATGQWDFAQHAFPGAGPITTLKYSGQKQKIVLTQEARKRGVQILNRLAIHDLIADPDVQGAVGVHTRENEIYIILAKAVVLSTGGCVRLYPGITPGWMFNRADSPHTTGDGRAVAYRAGAELVNMEVPMRWAGPKYFARCGKATWVGVLRDPQGRPVGPFVKEPTRKYGDPISDSYKGLFEDFRKSGRGPVYMDCRGIKEDDYDAMIYDFKQEGLHGILNQFKEEGIDPRKNPIEFTTYELTTRGGINYNVNGETSLAGLYAAGDEYFGGISAAATFGWIAGENAAGYIRGKAPAKVHGGKSAAGKFRKLVEALRNRTNGASWQEVNIALQQVMSDYAGVPRSDSLLEAGAQYLSRIKRKAFEEMCANNQHELVHCLEVLNLLDLGEIIFSAVLERKETRDKYTRIDHPYKNPALNGKVLVCRQENGNRVMMWKKISS